MHNHKGFSLIEVLVSLLLLSTLIIGALKAHWQNRYLLNQLRLRQGAINMLDDIGEYLYFNQPIVRNANSVYQIQLKRHANTFEMTVFWFDNLKSIKRTLAFGEEF